MARVTLDKLAYARSGDKGDVCNIGVMARTPGIYRFLKTELSAHRIAAHFGAMVSGAVEVYPMDNIDSLSIVLRGALGGGATTTLRYDQTGKAMGSALLRLQLDAGEDLIEQGRRQEEQLLACLGG